MVIPYSTFDLSPCECADVSYEDHRLKNSPIKNLNKFINLSKEDQEKLDQCNLIVKSNSSFSEEVKKCPSAKKMFKEMKGKIDKMRLKY